MTTTPTRAVAYIRVSSAQQAESGLGLEDQRRKVEAYAALYDIEVVELIVDAGASAKTLQRDGLQRALDLLSTGEAGALLVVKLDRLTRSVVDLGELLARMAKAGAQLLSVSEQIDTRTAAGRMVLNLLTTVSQWEREVIGERTTGALAVKKSKGERVGAIPFGQRLAADGIHLEEHPAEQEAIQIIETLREDGLSYRKIAAELTARGITPRGKTWHPTTVTRIVKARAA